MRWALSPTSTFAKSRKKFKVYAAVLGMTTNDLLARISESDGTAPKPTHPVPWVSDEKVLSKYRTIYHRYHQTRQTDDIFWIYTTVDFTAPYCGYLHALHRVGLNSETNYQVKAYGYLFRQILMVVGTNEEEGFENESVFLFPDFRKKSRNSLGHFGVILNEDWNGDVGFGGCLLFNAPFPGTATFGRQSPDACRALDEHWKMLGGKTCNRMLHLFGHAPYTRLLGATDKIADIMNTPSTPIPKGSHIAPGIRGIKKRSGPVTGAVG